MTDLVQRALTSIELREAELLSWGAVGAEWHRSELMELLAQHGDDADLLLAEMLELALVVETPSHGYRSRSAETLRLLATLRQAFRGEAILSGRPLILDYRFLQRPRRRPRRDIAGSDLRDAVRQFLNARGYAALDTLTPLSVSAFQLRSTKSVLEALSSAEPAGVVVTAGTGSGKTLAFYMPMLAWIADQSESAPGVLALALYPRSELLKDQLRVLVSYALTIENVSGDTTPPISLATWFGPTPFSASAVREDRAEGWKKTSAGYVCPYLRCPEFSCEGDLIWPMREVRNDVELLRCTACGTEIPGSVLRLTRDSARSRPARVMLSTTESLNRQLSSPDNLGAFGLLANSLRAVLLDEVHTYEGATGAQNAFLFRRLRKALGHQPLWAGLSATLAEAGEFFGRLVDIDPGLVTLVEPDSSEMEESGAEYLVALRHNPHGKTGPLSATIQTAMVISRALDSMDANPFNPPVDSGGIFGSRVFAFTDKLDSTNRLYWDLLDAEGWAWPGKPKQGTSPLTLAHLRSREQDRLPVTRREDPLLRDPEGQYWWLAEALGHEIDGDVQKRIGRTSSQDSGVAGDAEIIVATASLEVGFDDDRVGAVLQHKAPRDAAQFLQRKGRAGRNAATRPWTIVVLSDWGHDREAWDAYDALFSPVVPPRSLPLDNLYVMRIQAVYSLLDWLASELRYRRHSTWADASGPADMLSREPKWAEQHLERQMKMAELLGLLLRDGAERASLIRHLRRSLALKSGPSTNVTLDKLLWEAPRPLLGAVVPTLRRRLVDQWRAERPADDDSGVRTRTPLRDFVPGNLFDDLLVPDVEFRVPWARGELRVEHLPALRAIREFLPGNVSRHFGVWATNKRHWVPIPDNIDADGVRLADVSLFEGVYVDGIKTPEGDVPVYAPRAATLTPVPEHVSDASSMRADWEFRAISLGNGTGLRLSGPIANMFDELTAHLHSQGGGMRVMRFARTAQGQLWSNGQAQLERLRFQTSANGSRSQAALGVEVYVDAILGRVKLPSFDDEITPLERTDWLWESIYRSSRLPVEVSTFDRQSLADCAELFAASWDWAAGEPNALVFRAGLTGAAERLELHDPADPSALSDWLNTADVVEAVLGCVLSSRESTRSDPWIESLNRRFTQSAAEALLAALRSADAEDLVIDLDPDSPGQFFITEQSPGGTGHVESLTLKMIEESEKLALAITDVLRPSDMELLDEQLRTVIDASDSALRSAVAGLATSWRAGHEAVHAATAKLDNALDAAGIVLGHAAKTAIATRLAGPGASPNFIEELQHWLHARDAVQQSSGLAVTPRTLAALLENRSEADPFLHLSEPSCRMRSRAIANVLWPWGQLVRPTEFFNPYADSPVRSIELVRKHWHNPVETLDITEWNETTRSEVHDLFRQSGELILRAPVGMRKTLRTALIDLQTTPVEVGPLWCHPEVLAVQEQGATKEARLLLRETW
jgi:hypothetical protein